MNYRKMIEDASKRGVATEGKMWESVAGIEVLLELLKKEHPELYTKFMRGQHELLFGPHYNDEWAEHDLEKVIYTSESGNKSSVPHWSKAEVVAATNGMGFPPGTTDCDKYVAFNSMWADLHQKFTDGQIIDAAYIFYFNDEDAPEGKIWRYMSAMQG